MVPKTCVHLQISADWNKGPDSKLNGRGFVLSGRNDMLTKTLVASACLVAAFSATSFAQQTTTTTSTTYYVAQDVKTKKCTIVDRRPSDTTTMTILGDGAVFKTRTEAEGSMKSIKVCTTN
jgi:hypothetical protein